MATPDPTSNGAALSPERRALLDLYIRGPRAVSRAPEAPSPPEPRVEPCSHAQRRLWFLEQLQSAGVPYTLHSAQELSWPVSPVLLERAVNEIVGRHEILRTSFKVHHDGEPWQHVAATGHIPLEVIDLRPVPEPDRRAEAARRIASVISRRMDLEHGPLLRTALYQLGEHQWMFLLAAHHIVFDGPSFAIFFRELDTIYQALARGQNPGLPPRPVQYTDSTKRQLAALTTERVEAEVGFWRAEMANLDMLELPLDRRRSPAPSFRGATLRLDVSPDVTAQLRALAAGQNATLFMVLLAGLSATLSRVCGQADFAIGLPVAGRDEPDLADAIGFFVDTVVVRCRIDDDPTIEDLVARTRAAVSRSLAHRILPFDMLVEQLRPMRDLGMNPFFQVGFQLVQQASDVSAAKTVEVPRTGAIFDLGLDIWAEGPGLCGRLEYNTDLFDAATVEGIAAAFQAALASMPGPGRRVSDLSVWPGDRQRGQAVLAGEAVAADHPSVLHLLSAGANSHPDAVALDGPAARLTYRQLMARVGSLAGALARRGVTPGSYVALSVPRSVELGCLQLAAWHCGAAFVPVDLSWPESRRGHVLADVQPTLTVGQDLLAELWDDQAEPAAFPHLDGHDSAYAIFTSGSTGVPKGVVLEHAGLQNVAAAQLKIFGLGPGRRVAQLATPTFDASIFELVLALGSGAALAVAPPEPLAGDELSLWLREREVDTIVIPPSLLATMQPSDCPTLQLICVAGESCPVDLATQWQHGRQFWNLYGPTETTIWATYGRGVAGTRVPIGYPIPNLTAKVADRNGQPVAIGGAGELWIGGAGVARGYLNAAELTAARFTSDPAAPRMRLYRTGDLVRQLRDGGLVFLGRVDRQVKVRGFRIEPEEVETVLRSHPLVHDAVVDARAPAGEAPVLVAYLQCADGSVSADECRRLVAAELPQYMVPSHFIVLPEFPRSSSGKVDRGALPSPSAGERGAYVPPSTPTERRVAELMARAAHVEHVGVTDDFFHIGGHSLAAAELVSRARAFFNADLAIRDVFAHRTVSALAAHIDSLVGGGQTAGEEAEIPLVRLPRRHQSNAASHLAPKAAP